MRLGSAQLYVRFLFMILFARCLFESQYGLYLFLTKNLYPRCALLSTDWLQEQVRVRLLTYTLLSRFYFYFIRFIWRIQSWYNSSFTYSTIFLDL